MLKDVSFDVSSDAGTPVRVAAWSIEGSGSGSRVHLQAGVHADEIPGLLVLHLLLPRLVAAAERGTLRGSVTVIPQANPFGVAQFSQGRILGHFHKATSQNFNRGFRGGVGMNTHTTVALWQQRLLAFAQRAEIVLDLHTDDEALPYIYFHERFWPAGEDLAAALDCDFAILWDGDGGGAYEDAVVAPWLAAGVMDKRLATTVELRGQADVDPALAERDADGIYRFLCRRGVVDEPAEIPSFKGEAVPMDRMETLFAPCPGVLVFDKRLGETVAAGETVARIIARPGDAASEIVLKAPQAGRFVACFRDRLVPQGAVVAKLTAPGPSTTWKGGVLDP